MRIIIDTNLLISALINPSGLPGKALRLAREVGTLYFSKETRTEITAVLSREKFDRYDTRRHRLERLEKLFSQKTLTLPIKTSNINACRDPKDNKFLELAVTIDASCIMTGDKDLLVLHPFRDTPILTASEFISRHGLP